MRYTADSWFFVKISEKNPKALNLWEEITTGKGRLVVPTVVIAEIEKRFLKRNLNQLFEEFLSQMENSEKIFIVGLTLEIAKEAGKLGNTYNLSTIDSIILATAKLTEFTELISDDEHFILAEKNNLIKRVRF